MENFNDNLKTFFNPPELHWVKFTRIETNICVYLRRGERGGSG